VLALIARQPSNSVDLGDQIDVHEWLRGLSRTGAIRRPPQAPER
jgi:hypothetical protein